MTRSFDVFFDLRLNKRLSKQSWSWWFETRPSCPLWRHCNVLSRYPVMSSSLCNSFEDCAPVDEIYRCPIFKWVAVTWLKDRHQGWLAPLAHISLSAIEVHCNQFLRLMYGNTSNFNALYTGWWIVHICPPQITHQSSVFTRQVGHAERSGMDFKAICTYKYFLRYSGTRFRNYFTNFFVIHVSLFIL